MEYSPLTIEEKWLQKWEESKLYQVNKDNISNPYYVLEMFPYPSGNLHMGHVRNYTIGDTLARFKRMNGFEVLYPMGYDSFGLPAENAAIQNNVDPNQWTLANIDTMIKQQQRLGLSYDWSCKLATCQPDYYHWNQWIFIQMYNKGLIYRKKGWVNWDPVDLTVLANEQVIDGKGWRSGADVEKKEIEQWYIKITDYAEELLSDLDSLDEWPERVKIMQRNWIGKNTGTEAIFQIEDENGNNKGSIPVFTTRPDTLCGVTYLVLAVEHPLTSNLTSGTKYQDDVQKFVQDTLKSSNQERTDMNKPKKGLFLGHYVINPITGEKAPLYTGNYVLMEYGTGAVMAVPAHDQRDFEFAKEHNLPIKVVIQDSTSSLDSESMTQAFTEPGLLVNSSQFNELSSNQAKQDITHWLINNKKGSEKTTYRLRDWLISRQRFWGTPIPIIYDEDNNPHPVSEEELPVKLPENVNFSGQGNPLANTASFAKTSKHNKLFTRETDTMDTFFDSSWYFFRYTDSQNKKLPFESKNANQWLPVDQYIGGIEHAVLHLLYARFFTKVLRDLGLSDVNEPFKRLLCQGMVLKDGAKMSKSLGNTVDPASIISKYGADTARLFILFGAPVDRDLDWSDDGVEGSFRFLKRFFIICSQWEKHPLKGDQNNLNKKLHKTIQSVTNDIQRFSFNTAISRLMELMNFYYSNGISKEAAIITTQLIAPFAPFLAEELWSILEQSNSVHKSKWPSYDQQLIIEETSTIVIQVNGKVRDKFQIERNTDQETIKSLALKSEKIQKYTNTAEIIKIIHVPNKLLNIVVKP
ncbi:leucine--tRNA ligase [Candidatus Marinamargulisbacteria bacterium SCGC AG-410-N11]|nr:leucine--tRNA ligase [Candidatus Marinamargulisbacteria bacterium SCGC AG-410-N11]